MANNESVAQRSGTATPHDAPLVAVDRDFDPCWAAWVARGRIHDRRVRRRFVVSVSVIAIGAAIGIAFFA
jgi:hypothetical protein